jgi:amino acid adenylation domain-containing protein/thioester reductase-like protein
MSLTRVKQSFVDRFLEVSKRSPDACAIMQEGIAKFSYAQLTDAAKVIASRLQKNGVQRGTVVAIAVEKSPEYVASMLGIWFTGAAFVPIDPRLPQERIAFIIREANIGITIGWEDSVVDSLVTVSCRAQKPDCVKRDGFSVRVTADGPMAHVTADDPSAKMSSIEPAAVLRTTTISEDDLAYIIFTSGSTGEPKGVMVEHRGIVNFLDAQIKGFHLSEKSRALFYLSTNFDASVSDIGTALLSGATLCMEPEAVLKPGSEFVQILHDRRITHMDIPPSVLAVLKVDEMPDSLETIIIGGEACAPQVVRNWARRFRVVNVYGPTESTVCTSFCQCDVQTWERPLIGQPIPGVEYVVLDENLNSVPRETPGELYIGGTGLARGYLNNPGLTAIKFITLDGRRLYRTGDQVKADKEGEIEFLGRTDRQFKIRGLLVEPEEIEARLKEHAAVHNAVVLKRALSAESKREALVAFVVFRHDQEIGSDQQIEPDHETRLAQETRNDREIRRAQVIGRDQLREHLSLRLPRWMVPQHFEFVEELPQTLTGKTDISKLRSSALSRNSANETAPLDGMAERIAQIWKEVLELDHVSIDDDFFDLGGDSFAVIEVAAAAEARGMRLPPALLMTHTKLSNLADAAAVLGEKRTSRESSGAMTCEALRKDIALSLDWRELLDAARRRTGALSAQTGHVLTGAPCSQSGDVLTGVRLTQLDAVLVTGASGFLGSRLLFELLKATQAKIFCLVRAPSPSQAEQRVINAMSKQHLAVENEQLNRIEYLCGDLERFHFGLEQDNWEKLSETVDCVFHCAAQVNMLMSYKALRSSNVGATFEVIRFLAEGRIKALHYASTLSVFVATDRNEGVALENDDLSSTKLVYGGYAQTKWASEVLLRSVEPYLGPISYYRLGLITGDSTTGATADSDFLALFMRGLATLGCVPPIEESIRVDVTPIDYCARAIAKIALSRQSQLSQSVLDSKPDAASKTQRGSKTQFGSKPDLPTDMARASVRTASTFHIANPKSLALAELVRLMRDCNVDLESVSTEQFLSRTAKLSVSDGAAAAASLALCRSLGDAATFENLRTVDLFQATNITFDTHNTILALGNATEHQCPASSREIIERYITIALGR